MINTLCLGGGGIKGISYLGALKYLEENNAPLVASFHRIQLGGDA